MVEDLHPVPDLREFDKTFDTSVGDKKITLRYLAIDYGTHVGSVFKAEETGSQVEIASIPFESHWHKRGRYKLQTGPAKGEGSLALDLGDIAGLVISQHIIAALAQAQKSSGLFDQLEAKADGLLRQIAEKISDGEHGSAH